MSRTAATADPGSTAAAAAAFLKQADRYTGRTASPARLAEIRAEIAERDSYRQSTTELEVGAKLAWRNHARCVGKLYYRTLVVRDRRDLTAAEDVFQELVEHQRLAFNGGRIRPVLTVFAPAGPGSPGVRIWNEQVLQYAGYRRPDGSTVGDPANIRFTEVVTRMGWTGNGGRFDVLPLVIQVPDAAPQLFELPPDLVVRIPIAHPDLPWFADLGLEWYAFPTMSNRRLEIGGLRYPAAPFSGWYVNTEIGARNLADTDRYDMLPTVADALRLDRTHDRTLWKDRALLEINAAVLASYERAGVRMVDHHTISDSFARFVEAERRAGRDVCADWRWIVPPMSPAATPVYHQTYLETTETPNFFREPTTPYVTGCPALREVA